MEQHLVLLKQFVATIRANTDILHEPWLAFFREFMEEFGATIPPKKKDTHKAESPPKSEKSEAKSPEPMEEEPPIPYPSDIDNSGVIEPDDNSTPLPMGDPSKEASEEDIEKANEARDKAMAAFSEGNFDDALKHYTEAIELNPGLAILHAKRANVLLKLKRPVAAIADCDKAISINADSAQGYKFRGRAYRLLGKWVEAHADLATACKLDYDDVANEWLKEVEPNAKKIQEYNRAVARQAEERELQERRERVRRAQEANRKAQEEAAKKNDPFSCFGKRSKKSEQAMPLLGLPPHVLESILDKLSLVDMIAFKLCSRKSKEIVDEYWQRRRSFSVSVAEFHRLFPYIDPEQTQFESIFHIRDELGRFLRMLPNNRLTEANFSGLRRFHRELMEDIMIRNRVDACSLFSGVTSMSFSGCLVSCADLESLSYCMQNLKSLTLSDRLIDHPINGEDVDPNKIQNFRTYQKNGLIGHRARTIAHMKTLWPTLVQLTFV